MLRVRNWSALEDGDLAVVEVGDLLGVADEGVHVGGHEVLVLADADHDRAAVARRHICVGFSRSITAMP